ncbi:MAG: DapH/DapD/GlmU-related protein [Bacteroides uniformis]|nr:DapH/DapD/GlmU-related protein [Bacteroides uniformis]
MIVEEDCWIGVNVTLLMGVTIRRGTTVAAGAVVSKSTVPYSIVGGIPAKHIKFYWTIDQILKHEEDLYPENERYSKEQLEDFFKKYDK